MKNYLKVPSMKKTFSKLIVLGLGTFLAFSSAAWAGEFDLELDAELHPHEGEKEEIRLEFPEIPPWFTLGGGYRFYDSSDSERTPFNKYRVRESNPVYVLSGAVFSHPDRLTLDVEFASKPKDHFADIGYGYRDLLLIRGVNRAVFHNLNNIRQGSVTTDYLPMDSATDEYGLRTMITEVVVRAKAPKFPAHAFVNIEHVLKDGNRQQRWMGGAAYFVSPNPNPGPPLNGRWLHSDGRDVKLSTHRYGFGVNSHLGPVEAEYAFALKKFDAGADVVMFNDYPLQALPPGTRAPGVWPHNRFANLKGYKHSLKIHSNYTGKLVASATVSYEDRENEFSDAKSDYLFAGGSLVWTPATKFNLKGKYRFLKKENETPTSVTVLDQSGTLSYTQTPRPAIDSTQNIVSLRAGYKALRWLSLYAGYTFDHHERDIATGDFDTEWKGLADKTSSHEWDVEADLRAGSTFKFKVGFENILYDKPAYNTQPDTGYTVKTKATWTPLSTLMIFGDYRKTWEKRDGLHWSEIDPAPTSVGIADKREVDKDKATALATLLITKEVSIAANYAYFRNDVTQDVSHGSAVGYIAALGQPYESEVHMYGASVNVDPRKTLHLDAGVNFVDTKAKFDYDAGNVTEPIDIGSLSEIDHFQTLVNATVRTTLPDNFGIALRYEYGDFDERTGNGFTDWDDGSSHVVTLTLTKTLGRGI